MLRALRANATVWYAPDQAHTGAGAELLPFFGEPAMTNTATPRLARVSGAAVLPFQFRRLDDGSGYLRAVRARGRARAERRRNGRHHEAHEHPRGLHSFLSRAIFVDSPPLQKPRPRPTKRLRASEQGHPREAHVPARKFLRSADDRRRSPVHCPSLTTIRCGTPRGAQLTNDDHQLAILLTLFGLVFVTLTTLLVVRTRHETVRVGRRAVAARGGKLRVLHGPIRRRHRPVDDPQRRRDHGARSNSASEPRRTFRMSLFTACCLRSSCLSRRSPGCAGQPRSSCASAPLPPESSCWRRRCTLTTPPSCSSAERTMTLSCRSTRPILLWAAATFGMSSDDDVLEDTAFLSTSSARPRLAAPAQASARRARHG